MASKTPKTDIYQSVTDTIIDALEKGQNGTFELPWHGGAGLPSNARTLNRYSGVNIPLLWTVQAKRGYKSGTWGTYKQWAELGAQVKKGEKGARIVFWKSFEVEPTGDNQDKETRMFARYSTVFNADQVDGYAVQEDATTSHTAVEAHAAADALIAACGIEIRHGEHQAYYNPHGDYVNMPPRGAFKDTAHSTATENYYSTCYHELTHATGAKHRLDRDMAGKFGDKDYAFEELIAELGAAMLCAATGVTSSPRADHVHYLEHWLKALKSDTKFIFKASAQAQKAADYLQSFA